MIGLGTMGRNFLLNVAEQGVTCAGYDIDPAKRDMLLSEGSSLNIHAAADLPEFLASLETPRKLMLLVPAGPIVDSVIEDLIPHLNSGDVVVDGGNSHFSDTERRETRLNEKGFEFMGVGVSGGEEGARNGASIMVGGKPEVYDRVRAIFEAASAKVNGEPCAAHVGNGSAGHFVKMVHNGIEYAMMQLIAEVYDLFIRGNAMTDDEIAGIFAEWSEGDLSSFLIEITASVLKKKDDETGNSLVSMILDTAGQKGTGKWTSQTAMDLGVPIPTIDSAVSMRQISALKAERAAAAEAWKISKPVKTADARPKEAVEFARATLRLGFLTAFAQGMSLLSTASHEKGYNLDMAEISKIWRGGCIIRASMLEEIRVAFADDPNLSNLLFAPSSLPVIQREYKKLSEFVRLTSTLGIPCMAAASSLNYLEALSSERLPASLIQAQRDFFGAHSYKRVDKEGTFHTNDW